MGKGLGPASRITDEQIAEALRASGGLQTPAAKMLGVSQQMISSRIRKSPYLLEVRREVEEALLDIAETQLVQQIKKGRIGAIIFYLKCKGKSRGYIEKHHQTVEHTGKPQQIEVKGLEKLSNEQLRAMVGWDKQGDQ
jgi:predicted transcriptional regulator